MESQGFNHVHLVVTDLERSARFYCEAFGLQELSREPRRVSLNTPGRPDLVTLSLGDEPRLDHLGFLLADRADLDEAVRTAERAGGHVIERHEMEGGAPTAFVQDPDGYVLQL